MSFNFIKFFGWRYLFDLRPAISLKAVYALLIFFALILIIGLIFKTISRRRKISRPDQLVWRRYYHLFAALGALGLLFAGLRYERVYFFAGRFWLIVWLVGFLLWLIFILKYQIKIVPQLKKQLEEKKLFNQYLPKKK